MRRTTGLVATRHWGGRGGGAGWLSTLVLALVVLAMPGCGQAAAEEQQRTVTIAAASAMRPVMGDLLERFREEHPQWRVVVTFGASGNLYAQIANGAPFDVFIASDSEYPEALVRDGLAVGPVVHYATGRLVLWMPGRSALDPAEGLGLIASGDVKRIAMATPRHAPYGVAAARVLEKLGASESSPQRILGENVEQAAKFAHTGTADAALIPASIARIPAMQSGREIVIPDSLCAGVVHGAVLLRRGEQSEGAQAFMAFITGEPAQNVLREHRLEPPVAAGTKDAWE